jgi:hypothetical protein
LVIAMMSERDHALGLFLEYRVARRAKGSLRAVCRVHARGADGETILRRECLNKRSIFVTLGAGLVVDRDDLQSTFVPSVGLGEDVEQYDGVHPTTHSDVDGVTGCPKALGLNVFTDTMSQPRRSAHMPPRPATRISASQLSGSSPRKTALHHPVCPHNSQL